MEKILILTPPRLTWKEVEATLDSPEAKQKTQEDTAFKYLEMLLNLKPRKEEETHGAVN